MDVVFCTMQREMWYNNNHAKASNRMSEEEKNNLFYVCSLIEYVGRRTKNRRGDVRELAV